MHRTTKLFQLNIINLGIFASLGAWAIDSKCINIFYDQVPGSKPTYIASRLAAINLQNLLGHFPQYQQYIAPIHLYKKNEINRCQATFYLGSNEDANQYIPKSFYNDFATTKKSVVWMNYNVWHLGADNLKKIWQVRYQKIYKDFDYSHTDANKIPGFYKDFTYKGETFEKAASFDPRTKKLLAEPSIVGLQTIGDSDNANKHVISWAIHSTNKSKIPYILNNKNWWYIADMPLANNTEADRYQHILADLLFDILDEKPQDNGKRYALVRLEDVNPTTNISYIYTLADMFAKLKASYAISLIPIYSDPLQRYNKGHFVDLTRRVLFIKALNYSLENGASILMHGVTHQYDKRKNPYSGVSAEDYEFWDMVNDRPIPEDSIPYVINRLESGAALIRNAGFKISAWLTPHYNASALDITLFGQLFVWNVGRECYWVSRICNLVQLPTDLTLDVGKINPMANSERLRKLSPIQVTIDPLEYNSPPVPYVIYGDYYNVRLIPENLGYIPVTINKQESNLRSIDDILRDAKRNKVLRDVWASFYIHPILLWPKAKGGLGSSEGDTSEIERLIKGIQDLGYEFVDLKTWTSTHFKPKRPQPIEQAPILGPCKN